MLFAVSAAVGAKAGIDHAGLDVDTPFSGSSDAVAFLRTLDLDGAVVVAHPATTGEALLPELPIAQLYYPGHDVWGSYLPWNTAYLNGLAMSADEAIAQTREKFPGKPLVFITTRPMDDPAAWGRQWGLTLRHRGPEPPRLFKQEERYSIFTTSDVAPPPN